MMMNRLMASLLICLVALSAVAQAQTEGSILRSLAESASASAPAVNSVLAPAPATWVGSNLYSAGQAVTNGGNIYIAYIGGASASSGGPSGQGPNKIVDGGVTWYYYGASYAPTITDGTSINPLITDPSDLTNPYFNTRSGTNPALSFTGGVPSVAPGSSNGTDWYIKTGTPGPSQFSSVDVGMSFVTNAPRVEMLGYSYDHYRLAIDGQFAFVGEGTQKFSNSEGRILVDWNGVRKTHQYKLIESNITTAGAPWFEGVRVDASSAVSTPTGNRVRACFFGDSSVVGVDEPNGVAGVTTFPIIFPYASGETWPSLVGQQVGWSDVWNLGVGGTGYIANSQGTYAMIDHITDATLNACNVVLVEAGGNDALPEVYTYNNQTRQSAYVAGLSNVTPYALSFFRAIRAGLPNAPIIVFGLFPGAKGPSAEQITTESAIKSAFMQFNDSNSYFIPIVTDPTGSWISGTGNVNSQTCTGVQNSCLYISDDRAHPVQAGIDYFASRATAAIRAILPNIL